MTRIILVVLLAIMASAFAYWLLAPAGSGFPLDDYISPSTVWGLAILPGLLGALLVRRIKSWEIGSGLLLWGGLFAALIIIYGFKEELKFVGERGLSVLMPASVGVGTDGEVSVARSGDGHFHINGEVSGTTVKFLIDTGASLTVLTHETALRVGLRPSDLRFGGVVETANGRTTVARARVSELKLGPIILTNVPVSVAQEGNLSTDLLGMNTLDRLAGFERRGDRFILHPR